MGKLYYYVGSLENPFFRKRGRGVTKKQYIGGNCGGGVGGGVRQFADLGEGAWQKTAMHFM